MTDEQPPGGQWPEHRDHDHEISVPPSPTEAEQLLYLLLGRAIARCQVAEAEANTYYQVLKGRAVGRRWTLGRKANEVRSELPEYVHEVHSRLVNARNYLAHDVLFDHGGWAGHPSLDGPRKYSALYRSIEERRCEIEEASRVINLHLIATREGFLAGTIGPDGVNVLGE